MRRENGITLIALIITIIILVILAAVSVSAVYNMGIVGHAINGTQQYAQAAKDENEVLDETTTRLESAVAKVKEIQDGTAGSDTENGQDSGNTTPQEPITPLPVLTLKAVRIDNQMVGVGNATTWEEAANNSDLLSISNGHVGYDGYSLRYSNMNYVSINDPIDFTESYRAKVSY